MILDVLCIGHACFDLVFTVDHHLGPDEKGTARSFYSCGGGPAANAALTAARLGFRAAFAGYLGNDIYGQRHWEELMAAGVATDWIVRGPAPTPLSTVLVKPDGSRTLVNYRGQTRPLEPQTLDWSHCRPRVVLFDGHEPGLSASFIPKARQSGIATVLDAGSLHAGSRQLMGQVDYLIASAKFAREFSAHSDPQRALAVLSAYARTVVVTLGAEGLIWRQEQHRGCMPAFPVSAVDTTGAGDTFHGAFAAGLAAGRPWQDLLAYASAAAALCCRRHGARLGAPYPQELDDFLRSQPTISPGC